VMDSGKVLEMDLMMEMDSGMVMDSGKVLEMDSEMAMD